MKRTFSAIPWVTFIILFFLQWPCLLRAQSFTFGWSGTELIPASTFNNPSNWITNASDPGLGDKSIVTANGDTLRLNWTFGAGNRYKWAQCYLSLSQAISLADYDLFGFDLKGMTNSGIVGFELKFEDGINQAVLRWDGLAGLNRWAEKISASKKQFENTSAMDWSKVRVVSFAVYAQASSQYSGPDQGTVSIYQLAGTKMAAWERATSREFINPVDFVTIKQNAIQALVNRQQPTGLLTTWTENGSSWLYGQGLSLKALSIEGHWTANVPDNTFAVAAEKLALFLAANQQPEGYWPRAWNSVTGAITVLKEDDGTIWMGDFPWAITGLQAYFKKSGDVRVKPAIQHGLGFLRNLIQPDGKFLTINPQTGVTSGVGSCEAYAAAILSLFESGDTIHANSLFSYISVHGWDAQLRCWREATSSDRLVLFANTWMAYYLFKKGDVQKGLDALSLAGKVMYTHGNGVSFGLDGIVPLSVWNEGALSYIADGGPGSISLFAELQKYIHPDGMISHYNENLGVIGGIWAVDWHSLDGTSWLYYTAAGKSPFDLTPGIPAAVPSSPVAGDGRNFSVSVQSNGELIIRPLKPLSREYDIRVIQVDGRTLAQRKAHPNSGEIKFSLSNGHAVHEVVFVEILCNGQMECYPVILN
ncbi:MAG: hypothetical protein WCJ26_02640 [bacterium]